MAEQLNIVMLSIIYTSSCTCRQTFAARLACP